jgi:shikimate dehydrogenase
MPYGFEPEVGEGVSASRPTFIFIGVTTAQSSINRFFEPWMAELGHPEVLLRGVDLPLHADPLRYRTVVQQMRDDPLVLGGLVTTHKVDLFAAARDLFEDIDPFAAALGEVSSIVRGQRGLMGHALDPITAGHSLDRMLGRAYFGRTSGEVLCFGAGGSGASIAAHFAGRDGPDRPARFVLVNRSEARLDHVQAAIAGLAGDDPLALEPVCNADPHRHDELVAALPEGSVVINATGMGKDRPGSPITDDAVFPPGGIAWDVNYRGDLLFLRQARTQAARRGLRVEDGWDYFVRGWAAHIGNALHVDLSPALLARLSVLASEAR